MGMIALITPVLTSTVVSSEREKDTFELLRMTPLRPGEIFFGKLAPALIPSLLPLVAFLPAYGTICFLDPGYLPYFIKLVPILALATIFCCTAGLVCSVFAKDTSRATVFGYVLTAAVFLGPILLAWAASRVFSPVITSWIAMPSPLFVGLNLVDLDPAGTPPALLWSANLIVLALLVFGFFVAAKIRLASLLGEG
jgi:ABC-type transport system involved in multi-copper enzyme maturation permease subunit